MPPTELSQYANMLCFCESNISLFKKAKTLTENVLLTPS